MFCVRSGRALITLEVEANCAHLWESASLCNLGGAKWLFLLLALGASGCVEGAIISYQCETVWPFPLCDSGTSVPAHPASRKVLSQTVKAG